MNQLFVEALKALTEARLFLGGINALAISFR
jgi:hypothetical protein